MNIGDGLGWFFLGSLVGWWVTVLVQWWIRKVSGDFTRELKDAMKEKTST